LKSKINAYDKSDDYTLGDKFLREVSAFVENSPENSRGSFMLRNSAKHSHPSPNPNSPKSPQKKNIPNTIAKNAILHLNQQRALKAQKRSSIYGNDFVGPQTPSGHHFRNISPYKKIQTPLPQTNPRTSDQ
jgi:hypothetical protein